MQKGSINFTFGSNIKVIDTNNIQRKITEKTIHVLPTITETHSARNLNHGGDNKSSLKNYSFLRSSGSLESVSRNYLTKLNTVK